MTPQGDQEIDRYQHHFPEEEEQEQIHGEKHANHTAQAPQQIQVKKPNPLLNLAPRTANRQYTEQCSQHHHQ